MMRLVPIISSSANSRDIVSAMAHSGEGDIAERFCRAVARYQAARFAYAASSGIAAYYAILRTLSKLSNAREVVLPAYTAGSLIVAVRKAGLKPVLCDVTLTDFNADRDAVIAAISGDTLAVTCVHMFGIGMSDIASVKGRIPRGVFMIEDCAQAMGSKIGGRLVGSSGDVSMFSFGRGKNLPLYSGGGAVTDREDLGAEIDRLLVTRDPCHVSRATGHESPQITRCARVRGRRDTFMTLAKMLAFYWATKPVIYGLGYPFISLYKDTRPPKDIIVGRMGNMQAALGLELLKRAEEFASKRYLNGSMLIGALKDVAGLMLPAVPGDDRPAFNRLPVIFKDVPKRLEAERALRKAGIESVRIYDMPLHHMFDLGYKKEAFPNACYVAERLLTLPVYPALKRADLLKTIDVIRGVLK